LVREAQRVLKVGGVYITISYGYPEHRKLHFEHAFLKVDFKVVELVPKNSKDTPHYLYICQKLEGADEISKALSEKIIENIE